MHPVNNKKVLVSVVVITYKHENYIRECLTSILAQKTSFPIEILVGIDQSSDQTLNICREIEKTHSHKVKIHLNAPDNVILINNRRVGRANFLNVVAKARGTYIAKCDGDDYWTDPLKLQKQVDILEGNPNYIVCHHWHKYAILKNNEWIEIDAPNNYEQGYLPQKTGTIKDIFENKLRIKSRTLMFRNIIEDTFFPNWFRSVAYGDVALSYLLGKHGDFYFIDEPMAAYRQTAKGLSRAGFDELGKKQFNIQLSKNWIEIWDYADIHYKYQYHKEAIDTVTYYLQAIIQRDNSMKGLLDLLQYNIFVRKLPHPKKMVHSKYLLKLVLGKVVGKAKQKLRLG